MGVCFGGEGFRVVRVFVGVKSWVGITLRGMNICVRFYRVKKY